MPPAHDRQYRTNETRQRNTETSDNYDNASNTFNHQHHLLFSLMCWWPYCSERDIPSEWYLPTNVSVEMRFVALGILITALLSGGYLLHLCFELPGIAFWLCTKQCRLIDQVFMFRDLQFLTLFSSITVLGSLILMMLINTSPANPLPTGFESTLIFCIWSEMAFMMLHLAVFFTSTMFWYYYIVPRHVMKLVNRRNAAREAACIQSSLEQNVMTVSQQRYAEQLSALHDAIGRVEGYTECMHIQLFRLQQFQEQMDEPIPSDYVYADNVAIGTPIPMEAMLTPRSAAPYEY